jgi:hypothetical protein
MVLWQLTVKEYALWEVILCKDAVQNYAGHEILYLESLEIEGGAVFGGWPVL